MPDIPESLLSTPQWFDFFGVRGYDVQAGWQLVAADGRPPRTIDPTPLRGLLTLGVIHVDMAHVEQADLSVPLLLAPIIAGEEGVMVIDGWHRVAKALSQDPVPELAAYALTRDEALALRSDRRLRPSKPLRRPER